MVDDVESWLLDSDPALRWQVERDVSHDPPAVWEATQARVATEGFGARLLALQDPDGQYAADYFRESSLLDGGIPDPRMAEAIELVRAARQPDGTWLQAGRAPGRVWFETDAAEGEPSKWLTFCGTRVLDWWDSAAAA